MFQLGETALNSTWFLAFYTSRSWKYSGILDYCPLLFCQYESDASDKKKKREKEYESDAIVIRAVP